jgi:hypothetical protein
VAKQSLLDRTGDCSAALLVGCGGGGDIVQTLALRNYLERLGIRRFVLGEIAVKWWDRPGRIPLGGEITPLSWYQDAELLHDQAVLVTADTRLNQGLGAGKPLYEAEVARVSGLPTVAFDISAGSLGFTDACAAVMHRFDLDLFVTVDIGADVFFSGDETTVQSPLADAFSINCACELDGYYALVGYGCDAEMPAAHLERNVARVMESGGYLGAHGLTPRDVDDLARVLDAFPDEPVEIWPRDAARGRLGTHYCKGWWAIHVSPLAAVMLFFDPAPIAELNPIPRLVAGTATALEAEDLILANTPLVPETRLPKLLEVPTQPQSISSPGDR